MPTAPFRPDPEDDVLILVDVQPDFMPGGALPVPDGDAVVPAANALLDRFGHAVATQDWHPPGHISFVERYPGAEPFAVVEAPYGEQVLYPAHCVQGTPGAALHPALRADRLRAVFRKGFRREIDSYSGFVENDRRTRTGLEGYLRGTGARRVFVCGLATDVCVAGTARHAAEAGFDTALILGASRGIARPLPGGGTTMDAALRSLRSAGVRIVED